jgi:hypothetical protein
MNLTGFTVRYFMDVKQLSFMLQNFQSNAVEVFTSGNPSSGNGAEFRFGFSGITGQNQWFFAFRNGKIYDPEGRAFYSYNADETLTLSGNISTGTYDYFLNNELICAVGVKGAFSINAWYAQSISGATGVGNIYVNSPNISGNLSMQTSFVSGTSWSGNFTHNNAGPVVIRSGLLRMTDANQFAISGTCLSYNNGTNVVSGGATGTIRLNHTGTQSRTGLYVVGLTIYTDYGSSDFVFSGSGVAASTNVISNNLYSDTTGDVISTGSGFSGSKFWYYNTFATTISGTPLTKPIYLELSYISGATGNFSLVTGYRITSSGSGYAGTVYVTVTPLGGGYPIASGTAIISGANSGITGVTWLTSGYYTGVTGGYTLSFSQVSGRFASGTPVFAPAYVKSFTGQFQMLTGIPASGTSGTTCAAASTFISGSTTLTTGQTLVFMRINYLGTPDSANMRYMIKASGLTDSISSMSIYSGSGLAYRT